MSKELIDRLRNEADLGVTPLSMAKLLRQAANAIEALEAQQMAFIRERAEVIDNLRHSLDTLGYEPEREDSDFA